MWNFCKGKACTHPLYATSIFRSAFDYTRLLSYEARCNRRDVLLASTWSVNSTVEKNDEESGAKVIMVHTN